MPFRWQSHVGDLLAGDVRQDTVSDLEADLSRAFESDDAPTGLFILDALDASLTDDSSEGEFIRIFNATSMSIFGPAARQFDEPPEDGYVPELGTVER